jgi:hypothetical protein
MTTPIFAGSLLGQRLVDSRLVTGPFVTGSVANTTTETVAGNIVVPPADAISGAIYHFFMKGVASAPANTNVLTTTLRFNSASGTVIGGGTTTGGAFQSTNPNSAYTNKDWHVDGYLYCSASGSSGVWDCASVLYSEIPSGGQQILQCDIKSLSQDTTVGIPIVVTTKWSATGTGQATSTIYGFCERVQ